MSSDFDNFWDSEPVVAEQPQQGLQLQQLRELQRLQALYGVESQPEEQEPEYEAYPELSEVERRLTLGEHYQRVMQQPLFDTTGNPNLDEIAKTVESEIYSFAQNRLAELLGMGSSKSVSNSLFSDEEASVLKQMANNILRSAKLKSAIETPQVQKPKFTAPKPEPPKAHIKRAEPAKVQPPPQRPPPTVQKPVQKQVTTPPPTKKVTKHPKGVPPADGMEIQREGRTLLVRWRGPLSEKPPKGSRNIHLNSDGYYQITFQDVTPQKVDETVYRHPTPSPSQLTAITAMRAAGSLNNIDSSSATVLSQF